MRIKNYILFIPKLLFHAFIHTKKIVTLLKLLKLNDFTVIFKIFFINTYFIIPKLRKSINLKKLKAYPPTDESLFGLKNFDYNKLMENLEKDGCSSNYYIGEDYLNKISEEVFNLNNEEIILRHKNEKYDLQKKSDESKDEYLSRLFDAGISRIIIPVDLEKVTTIRKFVLSETVVGVARQFLNKKNFSIGVSCHISNPITTSKLEKIGNAQFYHFDNDFSKILKLYMYLNNVNKDNGPHKYIKKTHKNKNINNIFMKPINDEIAESDISLVKEYTGEAGTFFFTDAFGYHKGVTPKTNPRIMLNVHFGYEKIMYYEKDIYFTENYKLIS